MLDQITALVQVILIDLVLAGDNAIVVGMAAAGVARDKRRMVIFWGIAAAVVMRIGFALVTSQLLAIIGLTLAGGVLLLWVCWKLWREIRASKEEDVGADAVADAMEGNPDDTVPMDGTKPVGVAIRQVVLADVSMSLDNVLAVAGAAKDHTWVLILGLVLSVALMGVAAGMIARLLERHHWIAYVGLAVISYVAIAMIWTGGQEVLDATTPVSSSLSQAATP